MTMNGAMPTGWWKWRNTWRNKTKTSRDAQFGRLYNAKFMFDILIKNAVIIDGTGNPMYKGDIGIRDDQIEEIGYLADEKGEEEFDVSGRMVCPGFIDVNNQSDTRWRIFSNPHLESLIHQGITTIVGGNCGSSLAPLANSEAIYSIQKWGQYQSEKYQLADSQRFFENFRNQRFGGKFCHFDGTRNSKKGTHERRYGNY